MTHGAHVDVDVVLDEHELGPFWRSDLDQSGSLALETAHLSITDANGKTSISSLQLCLSQPVGIRQRRLLLLLPETATLVGLPLLRRGRRRRVVPDVPPLLAAEVGAIRGGVLLWDRPVVRGVTSVDRAESHQDGHEQQEQRRHVQGHQQQVV